MPAPTRRPPSPESPSHPVPTGPVGQGTIRRLDPAAAGVATEVQTIERRGRGRELLRGVLVLLFVVAGLAKFAGLPLVAERFAAWGYPSWMLYAVGALELLGAALLLSRHVVGGASLLALVMLGAVGTHVMAGEWLLVLAPIAVIGLLVALLHLAGQEAESSVRVVNPGG